MVCIFHLTWQGALFNLPSCPFAAPQKSDPLKVYPQLKGSFPENLKRLRNTMEGLDWKVSKLPCAGALSPDISRAGLGRGEVRGRLGKAWEKVGAGGVLERPFLESWKKLTRTLKATNTEVLGIEVPP